MMPLGCPLILEVMTANYYIAQSANRGTSPGGQFRTPAPVSLKCAKSWLKYHERQASLSQMTAELKDIAQHTECACYVMNSFEKMPFM